MSSSFTNGHELSLAGSTYELNVRERLVDCSVETRQSPLASGSSEDPEDTVVRI
jgi:hypothetical protein